MTTGTYSLGSWPVILIQGYGYQKRWSGADGKTIPGRVSRKSQWNAYEMAYRRYLSSNLNRIEIWDPTYSPPDLPGPTIRDNHSWLAGSFFLSSGTIGLTFPQSTFDSYWTNVQQVALLAKIRNKVNGHAYNMGVSLAEVDKLAGTVNSTLRTLSFGVVDLLKGNFSGFARRFGTSPPSLRATRRLKATDVSGRFLEMRYAWTPAIQDAFEAAKAFEALSNGPRQQTFRSARRRVVMVPFTTNYSGGVYRLTISRQYLYEQYEEMAAFRQMGLGNPLSIIWERIPWSFVVDWFIPIGTYMELIGQIPFMKGRWCKTDKLLYEFSGCVDSTIETGGYDILSVLPNIQARQLNLKREISFSPPPVPKPTLRVEGAVQGKRVANAVSLAHQVFAKAALVPYSKTRGYSKRDVRRSVGDLHQIIQRLDDVISFSKPLGK